MSNIIDTCNLTDYHIQMFFMKIQPFVSSLWQEQWDKEVGNNLHAIMPPIDDKYHSGCTNRKLLLTVFE